MNSQFETVLDIKSHSKITNPFVLKPPANSTSQQQIQLSISSHLLKKLSLIDFSQSKDLANLYKECLLEVIESPLIDLKCSQTITEILLFLENWQRTLGKGASWPHTRTCFYYLEDKLKKNKLFQNLDIVRLKRAQLEPNKKDFLSQIMAENIYSEELKSYIEYLKQQLEDSSSNSFSLTVKSIHSLHFKNNTLNETQNKEQRRKISQDILYSDTQQDWGRVASVIKHIMKLQKQNNQEEADEIRNQLNQLFEIYINEKLPVLLNQMKSMNLPKLQVLEELKLRKTILNELVANQWISILNLTISKLQYGEKS